MVGIFILFLETNFHGWQRQCGGDVLKLPGLPFNMQMHSITLRQAQNVQHLSLSWALNIGV
jgi:hypothetical protein